MRMQLSNQKLIILFLSILSLFLLINLPIHSAETARIPPGEVLDRCAKAWENVRDYQALLYQRERSSAGETKELWAKVFLIRSGQKVKEATPTFLLEFYGQPVKFLPQSHETIRNASASQPISVYYSDNSHKLYSYKPQANTLTIEWLNESGPLPELMQLAGFLDFDVQSLKEKAYLDEEVLMETIDGVETYRVRITPRKKVREIEPARLIWIDRKTNFPKRFAVESDPLIQVDFIQYLTNQKLNEKDLVPEVPENVYVSNLTQ